MLIKNFTNPFADRQRKAAEDLGKLKQVKDKSWYRIVNHDPGMSDVYVYDEIGAWGISANDFVRDLAMTNSSSINVHLNSPGGEVFDGIAIYNALRNHPAHITTTVDSLAASIASVIAMAGDDRVVMPNSQMMIHDGSGLVIGNAADMRQMADLLDKLSNEIASVYTERAGGDTKDWRTAMLAETWYSADEAVSSGLATALGRSEDSADDDQAIPSPVLASWQALTFRYADRGHAPEKHEQPATEQPAPIKFTPDEFRTALREAFKK